MGHDYICGTCGAVSSTSSNLMRHEATHGDRDLHLCLYCNRQFMRSDSARRHAKRCGLRGDLPFPDKAHAGRRRTACDRCAESKLFCDTESPCEACVQSGLPCSFDRLHTSENRTATPEPATSAVITFNDAAWRQLPSERIVGSNCPSSSTMGAAVNAQTGYAGVALHQQGPPNLSGECAGNAVQETLQRRLDQLATDLMPFEQAMLKHNGKPGQYNGHAVRTLFTTSNFDEAVDAIFGRERPTFPLVHRPTFDPNECTLPLLLTVFVAGYVHISPKDLCSDATGINWIDLFEEYVFSDQNLSSLICPQPADYPGGYQRHLETIIAGVVIAYLQLGSTDTRTRWRMHHQRLPLILEAARSINLFDSVHTTATPREDEGDWRRWIHEEMTIRTSAYLFFLDCELATFYRVLPHLAIADMRSALPSTEAAFAAPDAKTWRIKTSPFIGKEAHSLRTVTSMLMAHDAMTNRQAWGDSVSIHGLLQALCGLHHIIFTSQASYIMQHMRTPLRKALTTWKALWDIAAISPTLADSVSEQKYYKFGTQFHWFAQVLLDPASEYSENASADSLTEIHDLLCV